MTTSCVCSAVVRVGAEIQGWMVVVGGHAVRYHSLFRYVALPIAPSTVLCPVGLSFFFPIIVATALALAASQHAAYVRKGLCVWNV